jgi:hypothetical protein
MEAVAIVTYVVTIWLALGFIVVGLLNLAKWALRVSARASELAPLPQRIPLRRHEMCRRSPVRTPSDPVRAGRSATPTTDGHL